MHNAPMAIPAALRRAWRETDYAIDDGDVRLVLHVDEYAPRLQELMQSQGATCAAYLTAGNPLGQVLDDDANARRNLALADTLRARGCAILHGVGRARGGGWQEASLLVLGIDRKAAMELACAFEQLALLCIDSSAVPRLVETGLQPR